MNDITANKISSLYVHVPFCVRKCTYCDFYSLCADKNTKKQYLSAILKELELRKDFLELPLKTLFIGGGTPTSLEPEILEKLLDKLNPLVDENTEFSIEANPVTITEDIVKVLKNSRINRVNLGVQSFNESELKILGRLHDKQQVFRAWELLRASGFDNMGLDLIYAIPEQTMESWTNSIKTALDLHPEHLSCYALMIEPDTPLGNQIESGQLDAIEDSLQRDFYYSSIEVIENVGLEHYETSNFAKPGFRCRHNMVYWANDQYVALGPGATAYIANTRSTNQPNLNEYIQALQTAQLPPADTEDLPKDIQMQETVMMGLRLIEGIDLKKFHERFDIDIREVFSEVIAKYTKINALEITDSHIKISKWALFTANTILAEFINHS